MVTARCGPDAWEAARRPLIFWQNGTFCALLGYAGHTLIKGRRAMDSWKVGAIRGAAAYEELLAVGRGLDRGRDCGSA
jgi:hypothetical protein